MIKRSSRMNLLNQFYPKKTYPNKLHLYLFSLDMIWFTSCFLNNSCSKDLKGTVFIVGKIQTRIIILLQAVHKKIVRGKREGACPELVSASSRKEISTTIIISKMRIESVALLMNHLITD